MATSCHRVRQLTLLNEFRCRLMPLTSHRAVQTRAFHDYWTQRTPAGQSLRIPILKARHHLGALTSRGDRAENEDRFKVGVMNKLSENEEQQPFYFAIIDGYDHREGKLMQTWRPGLRGLRCESSSQFR